MKTKRSCRIARKRARNVPIAGGGFISLRTAADLYNRGIASVTADGELAFLDPLEGRNFHWHPGVSQGFTVLKGRAGKVAA